MSRTRAIFKDMVIATAGPMPDQFTDEKLKLWTEQRKGSFSKEWNDTVTHLLCTTEQFKGRRKNIRIKGALARKRGVHVVHIDWYDFSCARKKKLSEREFGFDKILKKERDKIRKEKAAEQAAKNLALGEHFINPSCYRIFIDKFQFEYNIELFRTTRDEFGTYHERYTLMLYQSYAVPRLYWFAVKFAKKQDSGSWRPSGVARPSECSGPFKPEFTKFKELFRRLTGIDWPDRIIRAGTTDLARFQYSPPTRGKPVGGNLPPGFTVEECFALNRELRQDFCSLFGDEVEVSEEDKMIVEVVQEVLAQLMRDVDLG